MTPGEAAAKAAEALDEAAVQAPFAPESAHALVAVANGWTSLAVNLDVHPAAQRQPTKAPA